MSSFPSLIALALAVATAGATLAPQEADVAPASRESFGSGHSATHLGNVRGALELPRDADGFFYLPARIGGVSVTFLIDTGTNMLILPRSTAARVGLATKGKAKVSTVGGMQDVLLTDVPELETAGVLLTDVPAAIQDNDQTIALMGMSTLSQLGRIEIDGEKLTIHPRRF
jgi:clan AA aspartic protease (TIGR02281 family)